MKRVVLRLAAERDIESGLDYYLGSAGAAVARRFVGAVDTAFLHISEFPATGSPRFGTLLDIPGLRSWPLDKFPYVLFYVERDSHLDVIRVLHQHSDIPPQLRFDLPGQD